MDTKIGGGTGPTYNDHRDFDYLPSVHPLIYSGVQKPPIFPDTYITDADDGQPNQNIDDALFNPIVSAMPFGCTNECTSQLIFDASGGTVLIRPDTIEAITHANKLGGYDVRRSLMTGVNDLHALGAIFNVYDTGPLDYFDTFRLAQLSGGIEKRSLSVGFPWFPSWESACFGTITTLNPDNTYSMAAGPKTGIMPMPFPAELANIKKNIRFYGWHNPKLGGWVVINGVTYYRCKSWQGRECGDNGYIYFSREIINTVMELVGTVAFTGSRMGIGKPVTVSLTLIEKIASYMRNLIGYSYGGLYAPSWLRKLQDLLTFIFSNKNDSVVVDSQQPNVQSTAEAITNVPAVATSTAPVITPSISMQAQTFPSKIVAWAKAIQTAEGASPASNNPGNLKYSTLTAGWGATKGRAATDGGYLCQFATPNAGFNALCNFLVLGCKNELLAFHAPHARTLQGFSEIYAGNPPQGYITRIAATIGVPLNTPISSFL